MCSWHILCRIGKSVKSPERDNVPRGYVEETRGTPRGQPTVSPFTLGAAVVHDPRAPCEGRAGSRAPFAIVSLRVPQDTDGACIRTRRRTPERLERGLSPGERVEVSLAAQRGCSTTTPCGHSRTPREHDRAQCSALIRLFLWPLNASRSSERFTASVMKG